MKRQEEPEYIPPPQELRHICSFYLDVHRPGEPFPEEIASVLWGYLRETAHLDAPPALRVDPHQTVQMMPIPMLPNPLPTMPMPLPIVTPTPLPLVAPPSGPMPTVDERQRPTATLPSSFQAPRYRVQPPTPPLPATPSGVPLRQSFAANLEQGTLALVPPPAAINGRNGVAGNGNGVVAGTIGEDDDEGTTPVPVDVDPLLSQLRHTGMFQPGVHPAAPLPVRHRGIDVSDAEASKPGWINQPAGQRQLPREPRETRETRERKKLLNADTLTELDIRRLLDQAQEANNTEIIAACRLALRTPSAGVSALAIREAKWICANVINAQPEASL